MERSSPRERPTIDSTRCKYSTVTLKSEEYQPYEEEGDVILVGVGVVARVNGKAGDAADLLEAAVDVQFVLAGNDAESGQVGQTRQSKEEFQ